MFEYSTFGAWNCKFEFRIFGIFHDTLANLHLCVPLLFDLVCYQTKSLDSITLLLILLYSDCFYTENIYRQVS